MNILIFGASFSGSTVLSGMLGAHSKIETLGEIYQWYLWHTGLKPDEPHNYFRRERLGSTFLEGLTYCRQCGAACPKWKDAPGLDDPTNLYRKLREHFKTEHIVDGSKHPHWFEQIIPKCQDDYRVVLIHKPVWSMLTSRARYMGLTSASEVPPETAKNNLDFWCYFYRGFRDLIRRFDLERRTTNVRYESLCTDPARTLSQILNPIGLHYESDMHLGFNLPHHEIAGNSKLKVAVESSLRVMPLRLDPGLNEAPVHTRQAAVAHSDARELMEWLGRGGELP